MILKKLPKSITLFAVLLALPLLMAAQSDFEKGMAFYQKRAENATGLRAPVTNIANAMEYFEKAFASPSKEKALEYYLRCCYFKSAYCDNTKAEKIATLEKGQLIGKQGIKDFPASAGIRYWYAVAIGARAKEVSVVSAAKEGVIDQLKKECEKILELDASYEEGGGYRFLGALHLDAPYIPFFLPWPDDEEAVRLFRKGLQLNPNHISGQYYLAKALYETGEKEEAITILQKVVKQRPKADHYLEDLSEIELSKSFLNDITK